MNTAMHAKVPTMKPTPSRRWLWISLFALVTALTLWGAWAVGSLLWADATRLHSDFDVVVNGQPWFSDGLGGMLGWAIAASVIAVLAVVALTVVLPMALGAVLLGVLLIVGLVVGAVALPVLLVLALLLSPLLALGGLAWMLLA